MPATIYADTSAIAKLFIAEAETPDLQRWLTSRPEPRLVASALLGMELLRLMRLIDRASVSTAERFLTDDVDTVEILPPVLADAAVVEPDRLRTLDAIPRHGQASRTRHRRRPHLRQAAGTRGPHGRLRGRLARPSLTRRGLATIPCSGR